MKVQMTDRTIKLKKKRNILTIFYILFEVGVPLYYALNGIIVSVNSTVANKISISFLAAAAIIVLLLNLFLKIKLRSLVWILLSIAYITLKEIGVMILLICITSLINDCIIEPILKNTKEEFKINYEIDRRNA